MKRILGFLMALMICLGIGFLIAPQDVYAAKQEGDIAGGVYDGVDWRVTADGELILGNGGTQTMTYRESRNWGSWPWGILRIGSGTVKRISIDGKVVLQGSIRSMFTEHGELTYANLTGLDTANVSEAESIFFRCFKLKEVDFTGCTFENTPNIGYLFYEDRGLEKVNFCDLNNSANTNYNIFYGCTNLKSITFGPNVSFVGKGNPGIPTPTGSQYSGKWIREDRKYGPYTPNELKDNYTSEMAGTWVWETKPCAVFSDDGTLSFIRPTADSTYTSGSTGTVKSISGGEYTGTIFVVDETSYNTNAGYYTYRTWGSIAQSVKRVCFVDEIKPKSLTSWFLDFRNCESMDIAKLNTSDCVEMNRLFDNCFILNSLDVSNLDTTKVKTMRRMFHGCRSLSTLNVSGFKTSQVTDMGAMFNVCPQLSALDVSHFDTSNVTDMSYMFSVCGVTSLDVSHFNTRNVTNMAYMFNGLPNLRALDVSSFETQNCVDYSDMFQMVLLIFHMVQI